jgi:hypothetical protein
MKTGKTRFNGSLLAAPAICKDGTRIFVEFTIVRIRNDDGKLLGSAAILRDVTTRWNQRIAVWDEWLVDRWSLLRWADDGGRWVDGGDATVQKVQV